MGGRRWLKLHLPPVVPPRPLLFIYESTAQSKQSVPRSSLVRLPPH